MIRTLIFFSFILLQTVSYAQEYQHTHGKIKITFTDIKKSEGQIILGLYNNPEQWTNKPFCHFVWDKDVVEDGTFTVEIDSLPRAVYAFAYVDDLNMDNKLNFKLKIPTEGWGMSTNPNFFKLKKPDFDEVSFELDGPVLYISAKMNYLF